ncbi:hypothetical protein [Deinococcus sonorensis]|uniref:Uncharacterized protein n=2 Tax=Deinococcus sonorensis TaxID=309891 RepID=A0AAU7UET0_9DEIO
MVYAEHLPKKKLKELVDRIIKAEKMERQIAEAIMHFRISPYPDIVIHKRNRNDENAVIIEVKYKDDERGDEGREYDRAKIKAFTDSEQTHKYKCGVFLEVSSQEAIIEVYSKGQYVLTRSFQRGAQI